MLRIDARVVKVETGAVVAAERVEGGRDDFFSLEKDLVDLLVRALALRVGSSERARLRRNGTESFDAWRWYSAGLDAVDKGEAERARAAFEAALRADPGYRAAKDAAERLAIRFERQAERTQAAAAEVIRGLDPKAPDLASKVEAILSGLDDTRTEQLAQKVELLRWLGERKLLACAGPQTGPVGNPTVLVGGVPSGGVISPCRHAHEVLLIAFRLLDDPDCWSDVPKVCERLIARRPADAPIASYCEHVLLSSLSHFGRVEALAFRRQLQRRFG